MAATREIFREDAYLKECTAKVLAAGEGGIELDQTVFYAEGGGQPGDSGHFTLPDGSTLGIVSTVRTPDGRLLHLPETPLTDLAGLAPGTELKLTLDWERRHRHMRMHTCLHLLCSLIPAPVTGGALSRDKGRLDFDLDQGLDKEAIEAALQRLIAEDHPVGEQWITDEEMRKRMDLVRTMAVAPPLGAGRVRLVEIDAVDLQPCGGTHVARTGEIGGVRLGKVENKGKHNRRVNVLFMDA
jgi:misacylated tRNA(Ala) deacylase